MSVTDKQEFETLRKPADETAGFVNRKKGDGIYTFCKKNRGKRPQSDDYKSSKLSSFVAILNVKLKRPISLTKILLISKLMKPCQTGVLQVMSL